MKNPGVVLIIVAVVTFSPAGADLLDKEFQIEFTSIHPDSLGMPWKGYNWLSTRKDIPYEEAIKRPKENYTIKEKFFMNIQEGQYYYLLALKSAEGHAQVTKVFGQQWVDDAELRYTDREVDCIISICTVENEDGEEFVVVDSNNNEDLSDDDILVYEDGEISYGLLEKRRTRTVETIAYAEFFDGRQISRQGFAISFRKVFSKRFIHPKTAIRNVKVGEVVLEGQQYKAALISHKQGIEYEKYDDLWIDQNQNGKFDMSMVPFLSDPVFDMSQPFTFLGKTYEVTYIDQFGEKIILRRSDANVVPPIAHGMAAPDFRAVTLDSNSFQMSDLRGRLVLLDFWGTWCGPCIAEIPYLKRAYDVYRDKDFEIVSIGIDDPRKLKTYVNKNRLDWIHIQQNKDSKLLRLYQVSGYPSSFLIDRAGAIVALQLELRGENLKETLERFID